MAKYKCVKSMGSTIPVEKGTVWEYEHDYKSNSDARLYAENGDDDGGYIDITFEVMEEHFVKIRE